MMKAMNFQDDTPSNLIGSFQDNYVLVFDLTSMQGATEHCHYPELVGEPLRLELNFSTILEHVTEIIVLGERNNFRFRSLFSCSRQIWICWKKYSVNHHG